MSGKVLEIESKIPIPVVSVVDLRTGKWILTDEEGNFTLNVFPQNFELHFKILGKQELVLTNQEVDSLIGLTVYLKNKDLRLDEVTVVADKNSGNIGSAVTLDKYAINQFQSFSLTEVLQQLPGQTITPPSLNSTNILNLRTAISSNSNAFGVSYIIDDMQVSNDENMQYYHSTALSPNQNISTGLDLRTIPASTIEKVEVIAGIPDAKYGNLTTGVIKIDKKAGVSPLTASVNLRQGTSSVSLNKGFKLSEKLGNLNISLDYLNANLDPTNSLKSYNRITLSNIWSTHNKAKTLKNTFSITLSKNLDDIKYDKDNDDGGQEAQYKKDNSIRINNRANWAIESKFVDQASFQIGGSYAAQESYRQSFINSGGKLVPVSLETALTSAIYTPTAYLQIAQVFGKPINANSRLELAKNIIGNSIDHKMSLGMNVSYSDNLGQGKIYDPAHAHAQVSLSNNSSPTSFGIGIRALDYEKYVKPQVNLGAYFQDNMSIHFANGKLLRANIGIRYNHQVGFSSFAPRVNMSCEVSTNAKIRGGIGLAHKSPSFPQLYPGNKYIDVLLADYRTNYYSFNLVQTYVKTIEKVDLRPYKIWKYEIGTDINTKVGKLAVTGFLNKTSGAITSEKIRELVDLPELAFTFTDDQTPPTYTITGYTPFILSYNLSKNAKYTTDKGIEFYFNFKKIKAINTSFSLNGMYVYTKEYSTIPYIDETSNPLETEYLFGYYEHIPTISDKLSLRLTITHHIPSIALLISLTAEQFTRTGSYASFRSMYPYAYMNSQLEYFPIEEGDRNNSEYTELFLSPSSSEDNITPAYHNFHLRITKEMQNGLNMSFYCTNFLNYLPEITSSNGSMDEKNSDVSFGAKIKYTFKSI
ncbi:TonB-dependent receptor [Flammeovirgaceae bacterium SG7u.111]|nr:TonB-dependent receptor [Flammeovirgaceae bacterium SG7u.132]WPO36561.1 TonB-dependent receptor [Flammeovirgaceae bacterium SG7u.111]